MRIARYRLLDLEGRVEMNNACGMVVSNMRTDRIGFVDKGADFMKPLRLTKAGFSY